jgi:hypothetical protein
MAVYTQIDNPELYFQVKLWEGEASSQGDGTTTAITFDGDEDMQPDMIWIKDRDASSWHDLTDSVRGVTKSIYPSQADAEDTVATAVTAIGSNGFTVGSNDQVNNGGNSFVAWCWKESATAGFDIVSYTGNGSARTISHSLSAVPKFIMVKNRESSENWRCYHVSNGNTHEIYLDLNNAKVDTDTAWNDTTPTSSVFSVGTNHGVNKDTEGLIAYLFAEKQGYSKFGSYTGNGNADGPFIYTGFRPAFIMYKNTARAISWLIHDNKRLGYNVNNDEQHPDTTAADGTDDRADILSNGFKIREDSALMNTDGETVIYAAFAEAPLVNSNGVPCNAR